MKNKLFLLFLSVAVFATAQIEAPQPSPKAKVMQTVGLTDVTVEYSRPAMKGRDIFGGLVPYGKLWRTGANENTLITFSDEVKFGGKNVEAGTYAIYTKPGKDQWEVMLYTDTNNWGNPAEWDASKVAASVMAKTEKLNMPQESWTIAINELSMGGAHLQMMWDETLVRVPFTVPTQAKTMANIKRAMSGPSANDYYQAAAFYLEADQDLNQAHEWITKATEMNPKAFWIFTRKSLIEEKMGNKQAAITSAKKALALAKERGNQDYVKINQDNLARWGA
ncbi:dihydrolipoamide dehydrogenase [Nonlabens spongiae]|uniref:Dihydrolipoamide dehydrogenase n=1 Tax=Nonlabens spongiae TaxID=331648 RepID=A0A1W6MIP1_9FLAO|nr:DUF2911 domain-containing protein [Nonlabens spongiae]ARN77437.1 dihydrolipoamide dehydrogenase [Nonlabens spongiae]